jgi:hypothetical protein
MSSTRGWKQLETRCREIIEWRMALLPYLRSAFAEYASHGTPAFRSPLLDFPDVATLHRVDDQYMVGDRLLVAPLFAGENGRDIVLPTGGWHDFWTGELIKGNQKIHVKQSQQNIPVYIRENAVTPWAEPAASTKDPKARHLRARVYGNGSLAWRGQGEDLQGMLLSADANASVTGGGKRTTALRHHGMGSYRQSRIEGKDRAGANSYPARIGAEDFSEHRLYGLTAAYILCLITGILYSNRLALFRSVRSPPKCQFLKMGWVTMSERDLQRIEVLTDVLAGRRTVAAGGYRIGHQ